MRVMFHTKTGSALIASEPRIVHGYMESPVEMRASLQFPVISMGGLLCAFRQQVERDNQGFHIVSLLWQDYLPRHSYHS